MVDGSTRRSATSASQGDSSSLRRDAVEVGGQDVSALEIADHRLHFAARHPHVAVHANAVHPEQRRVVDQAHRPIRREGDERDDEQPPCDRPPGEERAQHPAPRRSGARGAAEVLLRWCPDPHRAPRCRPRCARRCRIASRMRSPVPAIDPAPSVMTRSPGRAIARDRGRHVVERRHDVHAAAGRLRAPPRPARRASRRESAAHRPRRCRSARPRRRRSRPRRTRAAAACVRV